MKVVTNKFTKFNKILAFVLIILCLSVACSLAAISGSHSLTNTYDVGEVCDKSGGSITLNSYNEYRTGIGTSEKPFEWKYVYLSLNDLSEEGIDVEIQSFSNGVSTGYSSTLTITNGYNVICLDGRPCNYIEIESIEQRDFSFNLQFAQFRENKLDFSMKEYIYYLALFLLAFTIIGILIIYSFRKKGWKINWYSPIEFLQDVYISFGNRLLNISKMVPAKVRTFLRISAFVCWMYWIMFMYNMGKYVLAAYFKYNVILFAITLLLVAISLLEKPLKQVNWNIPLVHAWFWFSMCMCVSEFFVSKRFCMIGYINIIVFGFFYFVWSNMKNRDTVIKDIMSAFKIAFLISACFTLIFRPRFVDFGLTGHTWNPNIYGIFCAIVLLTFLAELKNYLMKQNFKIGFWINSAGAMVSCSFMLLAGSRAGLLLAIPGMIFFFIEYVNFLRNNMLKLIKWIVIAVGAVILLMAVHVFMAWATVNLPIKQIVFPWDNCYPSEIVEDMIVLGMDIPVYQKVIFDENLTSFLTSRNYYWYEYLREINFLGHDYYPEMWGAARNPHNGVLGIIYRYGILTAVPYILMFINAIVVSFKRFAQNRHREDCSFYVWICVFGISLCMLIENFERPFLATEWLWWYWCIGYLFVNDNENV